METALRLDNIEYLSALHHYLTPLRFILDDDNVTEICINKPFEAYVQRYDGKACEQLKFASPGWCRNMANLVANKTAQGADEVTPLLSADLPTGERIQFVLPPAAEHVSITIRRPSKTVWTLDELDERGLFGECIDASDELDEVERELLALKEKRRYSEFIKLGILAKKNFLLSGVTGSGKTTVNKALILEIPEYERIITIEDAKELVIVNQPDHVRLLYSKGGQGQANVTPKALLEACLRMKPDRLFLAELRGDEAFEYLRAVASHPGSITSVHGHTAQLALAQMVLLLRQSPAGQALQAEEIKSLLYQTIDIVLQFNHERRVKEVWFKPELKRTHSL
jgi:type IV secretion system protein VirB11